MKRVWFFSTILVLFLQLSVTAGAFNKGILLLNSIDSPTHTTSSLPAPSSCDVADVRAKLIAAGCIELIGMDNTCSLYFLNTDLLTGPAAQAFAESFGANLISIQSKAENDSLLSTLKRQNYSGKVVWMGFNDAQKEGDFVWFDQSAISYTNWAIGEPNNYNPSIPGPENCTQIYTDGTWNDLNCDLKSFSVIEVNLCPVTTIKQPATICLGDSVSLVSETILGAPDYNYAWTSNPPGFTSQLKTPKVAPTVNTTYKVVVVDRYKCVSEMDVTVTVNTLTGKVTASGPTTFCQADSVVLTAEKASSYKWSTGETTQAITVKTSGTYVVTITDGPCVKTVPTVVTVLPSPVAAFKNTTVCSGSATEFTDQSVGALVWGWNFGDGTQLLGQHPTHTYAKAGEYKVTLVVFGLGNCADSIQQTVTVLETPVVSFSVANSCSKDSIYFKNTSLINPPTVVKNYTYDFGDGKTSSLPDAGHLYTKGGSYKVTLKIGTTDGCAGTALANIVVNDSPVAAAVIQNSCSHDSAKFTNKSVILTGKITKFFWNFGDGSPVDSIHWNAVHLYAPGTYQLTLAVVSASGCSDTLKKEVIIYPSAFADFTVEDVCLNQPALFKDQTTGPVQTYFWLFGDTERDSIANPTHIYATARSYVVSLTVTTAQNCKTTVSKKITIRPLPVAKFDAANVCEGKNVVFIEKSTVTGGSINNWIWNFDDGSPLDSLKSPQHLYATVKSYNPSLKVISYFGCSDSISKQIIINPKPAVDFTTTDTAGCHPFTTGFLNQSTIVSGNIVKWLWDFGSLNAKSDLKNPLSHTFKNLSFTTPINYTIKLTATSDSGCVSSISKSNYITVFPKPFAAFTVDPKEALITNPIISFKNLSKGADSCIWDFNSIGISDQFNPPPYTYTDTGTFTVTLITSNRYGCADTTFRNVIIKPDFVLYIPNSFSPNGDEINDTFGAKGDFISDYEMTVWDRWGNVMYTTKDINIPWNGGIKGGPVLAESAVYVYVMRIKATNKKNYYYKGVVTVLK